MLRKTLLMLLVLGLVVGVGMPAEATTYIECEGGVLTIRQNGQCFRCHYNICCILYPDGELDCWSTVDICTACGAGSTL